MAFTNIEGTGVLFDVSDVNSGSGNYDSFLRLQAHGDEEGFNTDDSHEADNKEGVFTHSVQFSSMQVVTEGGIDYYEFRLDLNEGNAAGDPPITLEDLRFFYSADPATGADFDDDFAGLNEVFDLSSALLLSDVHTGSGSDDYIFRVPTSLFPDKTGYFTLYSEFSGAEGGFEEWRVLADEIGEDGLPAIHLEKTASPTSFSEGDPTDVTFTYVLTSQSSNTDPLTLTSFIDDNATPGDTSDDIDLLTGASGTDLGDFYVSGDTDADGLLDKTESWTFSYTTDVTLDAGETRTNIVSVTAHDDEDNPVGDNDDAAVTAFNLGRTPGFWSNNGSLLWDGNVNSFPKAGGLGIVGPASDLMYKIHDTDGDGDVDSAPGVNGYLMIGDWDKDGVADPNENVLIISRSDALSLLNSSQKLQQDGRYMLARDAIASWLNYLGGSFVGDSDDPNSAMHYIDEAVAWLIEATTDENHILTKAELSAATKVGTNTSPWNTGYDFNGNPGVQHDLPAPGEHDLGDDVNLDILGGGALHTGLDHYNNYGFI